jgi:serine/threonine protein kinase
LCAKPHPQVLHHYTHLRPSPCPSRSDLTILRPLGEGSYGKVYLASMRETLCAVKLLLSTEDAAAAVRSGESSISLSSPVMQALQKECGLMASLRHPNVVLFLGLCYSPPAIVTEYCSRGSLFDCLRAASQAEGAAAQLSWTRRLNMALDAAKGVLALHSHSPPMVHRDLKSPNLLVDQGWKIKICDFNLSKLIEESTRSSSVGGMLNPRWLAPEVLTGGSATAASDVFSFGVVLWELLTWAIPWEGVNAFQLVFMVSSGDRLAMPALEALPGKPPEPAVYDAYVALVRRCWAQDAADRPTFGDIISELRAILTTHLAASGSSNAAALAP